MFLIKKCRFCNLIALFKLSTNSYLFFGWGRKRSGFKAIEQAKKKNGQFLLLEDGFIRSLGLGANGSPAFSIVEDDVGIYYDATMASKLENWLNHFNFANHPELIEQSRRAIEQIKRFHLSKYNHSPDVPTNYFPAASKRVLVIAQTAGDSSLEYGLGNQFSTQQVIEAALSENPSVTIYLKIHPDVLAGKKKSDIQISELPQSVQVISEDFNPISLLAYFDQVYTKTSQMGFEALILNKAVVCFGMPFYAGWGLTDDRVVCSRRAQTRSLEEVFAAAYLLYSRYANPFTYEPYDLFKTLRFLNDTRQKLLAHQGNWYGLGVSKWKRRYLAGFLGFKASIQFVDKLDQIPQMAKVLLWAAYAKTETLSQLRAKRCEVVLLEDGFLRSVGLGLNHAPPFSLVLDRQGMYYDATQASDLETLLNTHVFSDEQCQRAEKLIHQMIDLKLTKYNLSSNLANQALTDLNHQLAVLPENKKVILVPGQVESDRSIALGSPVIQSNQALLKQVRQQNPAAFVIYKPHPDVLTGLRQGELVEQSGLYDLQVIDIAMADLLDWVDEVHTMTSLTGFEGLLRGKKVVCYGQPFYAGWGLTEDTLPCERRGRNLTLAELVVGALMLYPTYADPKTGHLMDVETAITLIHQQKEHGEQGLVFYKRWLRKLRQLVK